MNRPMAMPSPSLTFCGMAFELNGGATNSHAVARVIASRNDVNQPMSSEKCISGAGPTPVSGEVAGDAGEELVGEVDHHAQGPVAGHEQRDAHGDELGDERDGRLLQLRR